MYKLKGSYPPKIHELADSILESRLHAPQETILLCKRLIRMNGTSGCPEVLGFAYYFLGEACYTTADYPSLYALLIKALKYQEEAKSYELIARTYNILGLISSAQENVAVALENFCSALDYCKSCRLYYIEGILYVNIGELYKKLHAGKPAVKFLMTGIKYLKHSPDTEFCRINLLISYALLGFCHIAQNDMVKAEDCCEQIISLDKQTGSPYYKPALYTFLFRYFHCMEKPDKRDAMIPEIKNAAKACTSVYEFSEFFFDSCQLLSDLAYGDGLIELIHILERLPGAKDAPALRLRLLNYKVCYYKGLENQKHYNRALMQYFEAKERQLEASKEITRTSINFRFMLETLKNDQRSMEEMNRLLKTKSERDPLTGLANYMHLKNHLEQQFEKAMAQGSMLGVELLDIDYFKQYNDNYGHISGDRVLTSIAGLLKKMESDRVFCGRYGGDEFIIIYAGLSDDAILALAEALRSELWDLAIEHCGSPVGPYVSISQGIRNSVPIKENKSWDYLFAADMALYDVKANHKSSIHLIHRYFTPA